MNALDIIRMRESGNRNIYQQLVPRDVSSASGYFQMIKPTWRRWAQAAGVDISRYPEAIMAPYDVQRAVAGHGFRTEGFRPWEATKGLVGQEANYSVGGGAPAGTLNANPVPAFRNLDDMQKQLLAQFPALRITSGYRSPDYNRQVGGAKGSQHMHGTAIDIGLKEFDDATRQQILDYALARGVRGIGFYPGSQSAHLDLRSGAPAAWGPNRSSSSLGETPEWFQSRANSLLAGNLPTIASTGPTVQGLLGSAESAMPDIPGAPIANAVTAFAEALGEDKKEEAPPAPAPAPAPAVLPQQVQQFGQAANLMSNLLARRWAARPGMMPRGLLGGRYG